MKINRAQRIFLTVFILSAVTACALSTLSFEDAGDPTNPDSMAPEFSQPLDLSLWISLVTAGASLLGFISSGVLGWRREAREKRKDELDAQIKEIELEKRKLELEKMKAELGDQEEKG